ELAGLKAQVEEATALLNRAIDGLREQNDRAVIDYYASDLADAAVAVLRLWLLLQDARTGERKQALARVAVDDTMPRLRALTERLQAASRQPLEAQDALIAAG
ncbi:MAG: hypothetical protein GX601_05495, partial [Anaerolineales bacterium]|nr:hypothetical protein [Anaerolineales bacterium]